MQAKGEERSKAAESKWFIRVHSRLLAALFCLAAALSAQTRLTLQQAVSRMAPDWTPVYDGKEVLVSGQVSVTPVWVSESLYLAIQDQSGYGLLLEGSERQFRDFAPGDFVESQGTISRHAGLAVLIPRTLRRTGRGVPPVAKIVRLSDLASFRYLGVLVTTESAVAQEKENAASDVISLGEEAPPSM